MFKLRGALSPNPVILPVHYMSSFFETLSPNPVILPVHYMSSFFETLRLTEKRHTKECWYAAMKF